MSTPLADRIAAAPISWGVCEVPGWGWQHRPETVLTQMRQLGVSATEFGPDGFLPDDPQAKAQTLADYDLSAVGQFVPVVLHDPGTDPMPTVQAAMEGLIAAGAGVVVIAAATGVDGYDDRPELGEDGWTHLLGALDRIDAAARERGLTAALHPHVGTMVESGEDTERVLAGSRIGLCLDTGHLLIGGGDPVALAATHPERVVHVHLKDVDLDQARQVQAGQRSYTDAVRTRMYVALGEGDVDIAAIVSSLEGAGYTGWYVLEQDMMLAEDPAGTGSAAQGEVEQGAVDPVIDVRASIDHLLSVDPAKGA